MFIIFAYANGSGNNTASGKANGISLSVSTGKSNPRGQKKASPVNRHKTGTSKSFADPDSAGLSQYSQLNTEVSKRLRESAKRNLERQGVIRRKR